MQGVCVCHHSLARPTRQQNAPSSRRTALRRPLAARAAQDGSATKTAEPEIEGLSTSYCDEFVCTSSPLVEASVRQLARDIERANGRWAPIYATTVEYKDALRSFNGPDGYAGMDFIPTNVQQAAVEVASMKMLDNSSAEIRWRLTGKLGLLPIDIDVAVCTEIGMNLLTGRIERHRESWDLGACSPPAAAAWTASRALWAAKRASGDAQRTVNRVLDSLTSDDDDGYQQPDPNNPGRFVQPDNSFKQDAMFFVGVVALFYVLVQSWTNQFSS